MTMRRMVAESSTTRIRFTEARVCGTAKLLPANSSGQARTRVAAVHAALPVSFFVSRKRWPVTQEMDRLAQYDDGRIRQMFGARSRDQDRTFGQYRRLVQHGADNSPDEIAEVVVIERFR